MKILIFGFLLGVCLSNLIWGIVFYINNVHKKSIWGHTGTKKKYNYKMNRYNTKKNIKLRDFLALTDKNMFVDIINNHGSKGALRAEELLSKRPELKETYIQTNGIECRIEVLDNFLAYNSELRKDEFFEGRKNEDYVYLLIYVED